MGFKKYLYFLTALIVSTFMFSSWSRPIAKPQSTQSIDTSIAETTPTATPEPTIADTLNEMPKNYNCPSTAWVDCIPGPDISPKPECQKDYLDWAVENCPEFEGAAL